MNRVFVVYQELPDGRGFSDPIGAYSTYDAAEIAVQSDYHQRENLRIAELVVDRLH